MTGREDNRERCRVMLEVVTRAVRSFVLPPDDTEDLIQDAMILLLRCYDRLPAPPAALASFARTTARRVVFDHLRMVSRRASHQCRWVYVDTVGGGDDDADQALVSVVPADAGTEVDPFVAEHVRQFLAGLSDSHREALLLCASGYSYDSIAEVTGASKGTVRSRIHYARKRADRELKPLLA